MPYKMIKTSDITHFRTALLQLIVLIVSLWTTSLYSYVLFHTLAEIVSVILAVAIFLVAWNARRYWNNNYYILLGLGFLFAGAIDLFHAFEYKGVGIIHNGGDANTATQLWLAGRFLLALSFLAAAFLSARKVKVAHILAVIVPATILMLVAIFWDIFPVAYIEGEGLTMFKKTSEYFIILLFCIAFFFFYRMRERFHERVFSLLSLVLLFMVLTEISFLLYVGVYDFFNLFGHMLKIAAYYLAYIGIVEYGLMSPYASLFKDLKDKEAVLLESEERYRSLVEFSPDAIIVHRDGIVEYVNGEAAELFDVKEKDTLIGKELIELFHPNYHDLIRERLRKIESGEISRTALAEMKIVRPDKEIVDVEVKGMKVMFGGRRAIESIISNITERKQAEEKIQRAMDEWVLMFNSISDPAFIMDTDHVVKHVNKAMCDFSKMSEGELVGKKCFEFMHKQLSPWTTCPMRKTCQNKKPHTEEIYEPIINKTLLVTTSPILDNEGKIIGILHIAKDITEKKEIEKAKDEFISLASHQLRTPLSSISLASELLLRGAGGDMIPEQKELLDEIYESTKRMSALIGNMLNVSRIELGTLAFNPEPMEMSKSIEEIANELESQIKDKKLVLKKEFEPGLAMIEFDKNILRIIVENLLTNAIRYTASGGAITVSLAKEASQIVLKVCDTGCGIPKSEQGMIFQKSFRAKNAKQISADGHGLGLYMVKEVVDKIGAKISFVSEEHKGTTFSVSFPAVI